MNNDFYFANFTFHSKFSSGYPVDMYTALEWSVNNTDALDAYPGFTITDIMSSWIEQAGHPLLHVNVDYDNGIVTLTQVQKLVMPSILFVVLVPTLF